MEKIIIEVWSDYVCPFCYLELPLIEQLARDEAIEARWRAYELRPEPTPTLDPKSEYLRRVWAESVYPMAGQRQMTLRLPPVQPRSRRAFETAEFARAKGNFPPLHRALFRAFFEKGRDIGTLQVLLDVASAVGFETAQLLGSLEARENEPRVLADQKLARRLGVTGVPAMIVRRESTPVEAGLRMTGAQSLEALRAAVQQVRAGVVE